MSTAAKRAAKRRAKKEEADNHAVLSTMEQVAATMSVAGAAAGAATSIAATATAPAAAAAAPTAAAAAASSNDPRANLKEMGNKAFVERRMIDAIRCFTEAIEAPVTVDTDAATAAAASSLPAGTFIPPFLASVYSNRSAAYAAVYEWDAALADAQRVIDLAPTWSKGHFRRGQALEGLMNLPLARDAYKSGLDQDASDVVLARQLETVESMLAEMSLVTSDEATANPEEDKWAAMQRWLIVGKCRYPSLYLKYYSEDYRGVHSNRAIGQDEVVLEVPLSHIMTSEVAKASEIGQQMLSSNVELNSTHSFLAVYLLQERSNPHSFWAPYIACLPQNYRNMPIFFTVNELRHLKGSFSLGKIQDRHAELKEEYDSIAKSLPEFGSKYTLHDFVWARTVVITRIFGLMINGNKTDGLVPMADMLNHKRPRETSWTYDDARGAFTITALHSLTRGAQIFDSYGRKCNSRFFVNYGFALEENEDNQACLWFTLPPSDPHYQTKVRLLAACRMSLAPNQPKRFQVPIDYTEDVTKECFSFLRFVHAKDSELLLLSSNDRFDVRKIEPLSLRNEIEVINDLAIAAETSLSQFDTTIEDDNRILADQSISSNVRNAVLMRRGEKQVLAFYMQLVQEVMPLINLPWSQFKKLAAKCYGPNPGRFDTYITTVIVPLKKSGH